MLKQGKKFLAASKQVERRPENFNEAVPRGQKIKYVKIDKTGEVGVRVDKGGVIHGPVGKMSFETPKLLENASSLIQAVIKANPSAAKGKYVKSVTICSSMGPGVHLDVTAFNAKQA